MQKQEVDSIQERDIVQQKQPYEKPQFRAVQLFADEVLNTCKFSVDPEGCSNISAQSG